MRRTRRWVVPWFVLFVLAGCNRAPDPVAPRVVAGDRIAVAPHAIVPIDSPIRLRIREKLALTGRQVELHAMTTRDHGSGGPIVTRVRRHERLLSIEFVAVHETNSGGTIPFPASAMIPLDPTWQGEYGLQFRVNGDVVPARLSVGTDAFRIRNGEGRWITWPVPLLHRVPRGAVWGFVRTNGQDPSIEIDEILDSLATVGAHPVRLAPGEYDYFQVGADGRLIPRSPASAGFLVRSDGFWPLVAWKVRQAAAGSAHLLVQNDLGQWWAGRPPSGSTASASSLP